VVIRADVDTVSIGSGTNIQDGTMIHINYDMPVIIGSDTTVGHGAILHGCRIADNCLIGMGAILLDDCSIGEYAIVAAGTLVTEGTELAGAGVYMGIPAKRVRDITAEEKELIRTRARDYIDAANDYGNRT
jgi:carbonic anhydrase/acetyltransferase-like protein (isoleucine patch superfamily)